VQTLFVREPGDLAFGRLKNQQARGAVADDARTREV
jgi:hypothetical protein